MAGRASFKKRQKEQQRKERREEKLAKRLARNHQAPETPEPALGDVPEPDRTEAESR